MKPENWVEEVGTTMSGEDVAHALRGEWNYGGINRARCGVALHNVYHDEEGKLFSVTCKNCRNTI